MSPPDPSPFSNPLVRPSEARRLGRMARILGLAMAVVATGILGWVWQHYGQSPPCPIPLVNTEKAGPAEQKSIHDAQELVRRKPRSGTAWGRLGMVLLAHNFEDAAGACFSAAQRLDPETARWPYYAGVTQAISDPEQALVQFAAAARLDVDAPWPKFRQAELLLDFQRLDEAEVILKGISVSGQETRLLYDQVRLALLRQNREALTEIPLDQLRQLQAGTNRRACLELLVQVWHRLERPAEEQAVRRQLQSEAPGLSGWEDPYIAEVFALRKDPAWQANHARHALAAGQFDAAIQELQTLAAEYPEDPQWPLELARAWVKARNTANASLVLNDAAKQHPNSAEVHFELGNLQFQASDWAAAVTSYSVATRLKPDYGTAYYNLGQAELKLQHQLAAMGAFRQALKCQPDLAAAHINLGDLLLQSGTPADLAEAQQHLERALKLAPQDRRAAELFSRLPKP